MLFISFVTKTYYVYLVKLEKPRSQLFYCINLQQIDNTIIILNRIFNLGCIISILESSYKKTNCYY